jgi:hypothetical protein
MPLANAATRDEAGKCLAKQQAQQNPPAPKQQKKHKHSKRSTAAVANTSTAVTARSQSSTPNSHRKVGPTRLPLLSSTHCIHLQQKLLLLH